MDLEDERFFRGSTEVNQLLADYRTIWPRCRFKGCTTEKREEVRARHSDSEDGSWICENPVCGLKNPDLMTLTL